jgi:Rrf2 family transcriptional regulator, cysteine metabolism repressor
MELSTRSKYGIRAMLDLALHYGEGPIKRQDIAARQGIPEAYLVQLFLALRTHGLVNTARGPSGGHFLTRDPREISLKEVVLAFEGDRLAKISTSDANAVVILVDKVIDKTWSKIQQTCERVLSSTTLANLVEDYRQMSREDMYYI